MMSEVQHRLFGWCSTGHHERCRESFTTGTGIVRQCNCPCHEGT